MQHPRDPWRFSHQQTRAIDLRLTPGYSIPIEVR